MVWAQGDRMRKAPGDHQGQSSTAIVPAKSRDAARADVPPSETSTG